MSILKHILLLVLAIILQTTWGHSFSVFGQVPDLVILALIHVALATGSFEATILGFGIGFFQDIYMPDDLGLNALIKSILGFAVGWGRTGIMADNIQVQVVLIFGAVLVHDLLYSIGHSDISWLEVPFFWLRHSPGRALYTSLIGALLSVALLARRRLLP